jgi:hypothetical protein
MDDRDTQSALVVRRDVVLGIPRVHRDAVLEIPLALAVHRDAVLEIPLVLAVHRDAVLEIPLALAVRRDAVLEIPRVPAFHARDVLGAVPRSPLAAPTLSSL